MAKPRTDLVEIDFEVINQAALASVECLLAELLPGGHLEGAEWVARNPTRHDRSPGSFKVNARTGRWGDFATKDSGGDLISLVAFLKGVSQVEAARFISERLKMPPSKTEAPAKNSTRERSGWLPILPVPENAPMADMCHREHGQPVASWTYRDQQGRALFHVVRFQTDVGKVILPMSYCKHGKTGHQSWRWKSPPRPRPLYGLDRLASNPAARVVLVEGEKAADAAATLLPNCLAVTSPNGSNGVRSANWAPLKDRSVVIWPDNDRPGQGYAHAAAEILQGMAASVRIVASPNGASEGWDAADALAAGWTQADAEHLIEGAASWRPSEDPQSYDGVAERDAEPKGRRSSRPTSANLVSLFHQSGAELWRRERAEEWCSIPIDGHFENHPLQSQTVEKWLFRLSLHESGQVPAKTVLEETIRTLQALAFDCPSYRVWRRIAQLDNVIFVDLGDETHRAVKVTAHEGWWIVDRPPVKFARDPAMKPLPMPEPGGLIEQLRPLLNVASDRDFYLLIGWLVAAFRPEPPLPILLLTGEQGSAKTTISELMMGFIDPRVAGIGAMPGTIRDLFIAAQNARVLAFDNVSAIRPEISDALCMLATGGGYTTRKLHTDGELTVIQASPAVILNGIVEFVTRSDLADRCIPVSLAPIASTNRQPLSEMQEILREAAPEIMGALLDGVSSALRHWSNTKLDSYERMADTQRWVMAAEPGLGWPLGTFNRAYREAKDEAREVNIERSLVAVAIARFVNERCDLEGSATVVLRVLSEFVDHTIAANRFWPQTPQKMGNEITRAAGDLRALGIAVDYRHSGTRTWYISKSKAN